MAFLPLASGGLIELARNGSLCLLADYTGVSAERCVKPLGLIISFSWLPSPYIVLCDFYFSLYSRKKKKKSMVPKIKILRGSWSTGAFKSVKQCSNSSLEPVFSSLILLLKNMFKRISPGGSMRLYQSAGIG